MRGRTNEGLWKKYRLGEKKDRTGTMVLCSIMCFDGRANQSKKVVDDENLTYFIIRYRYIYFLRFKI
jgi:hypothetical protein